MDGRSVGQGRCRSRQAAALIGSCSAETLIMMGLIFSFLAERGLHCLWSAARPNLGAFDRHESEIDDVAVPLFRARRGPAVLRRCGRLSARHVRLVVHLPGHAPDGRQRPRRRILIEDTVRRYTYTAAGDETSHIWQAGHVKDRDRGFHATFDRYRDGLLPAFVHGRQPPVHAEADGVRWARPTPSSVRTRAAPG